MHATDFSLVSRLQRKDPVALGDLYDLYGAGAYSTVLAIIRNESVAEDLVQETFLRVWNRAHRYDPSKGSLGTWVRTVARNQALDYLRSVEGRLSAQAAPLIEAALSCAPRETAERVCEMSQVLNRLNDHQRLVMRMAFYEGLSHSEIAKALQRPLGTIKTWARTGLQSMRAQLSAA